MFPNFFTATDDCTEEDEHHHLYDTAAHCYSSDPRTDVMSGPIFCENRVDGFYVNDGEEATIFTIQNDYDKILNGLYLLDNKLYVYIRRVRTGETVNCL